VRSGGECLAKAEVRIEADAHPLDHEEHFEQDDHLGLQPEAVLAQDRAKPADEWSHPEFADWPTPVRGTGNKVPRCVRRALLGRKPLLPGNASAHSKDMTLKQRRLFEQHVRIHWGGREFHTDHGMSEIFVKQVRETAEAGRSELVPLLHEGGLDLLLVTPTTIVTSHPVERREHATSAA